MINYKESFLVRPNYLQLLNPKKFNKNSLNLRRKRYEKSILDYNFEFRYKVTDYKTKDCEVNNFFNRKHIQDYYPRLSEMEITRLIEDDDAIIQGINCKKIRPTASINKGREKIYNYKVACIKPPFNIVNPDINYKYYYTLKDIANDFNVNIKQMYKIYHNKTSMLDNGIVSISDYEIHYK